PTPNQESGSFGGEDRDDPAPDHGRSPDKWGWRPIAASARLNSSRKRQIIRTRRKPRRHGNRVLHIRVWFLLSRSQGAPAKVVPHLEKTNMSTFNEANDLAFQLPEKHPASLSVGPSFRPDLSPPFLARPPQIAVQF